MSEGWSDARRSAAEQLLQTQRQEADAKQTPAFIVRTLCSLTTAAIKNGKLRDAQLWASEAHQRDPGNPRTWEKLADAMRAARQFAAARAIAWEGVERFPYALRNWISLAEALVANGENQLAYLVLRHAEPLLINQGDNLQGHWASLKKRANTLLLRWQQQSVLGYVTALGLLGEARFLRHWLTKNPIDPQRSRYIGRARKCLERMALIAPNDTRLLAEQQALTVLEDSAQAARAAETLESETSGTGFQAISSLVTGARCQRILALERQENFHDPSARERVLRPARRLAELEGSITLVSACSDLAAARGLSSMKDGTDLLKEMGKELSKLAKFTMNAPKLLENGEEAGEAGDLKAFHSWVARSIQTLVFDEISPDRDSFDEASLQSPTFVGRLSRNVDLDLFEDSLAAYLSSSVVLPAPPPPLP